MILSSLNYPVIEPFIFQVTANDEDVMYIDEDLLDALRKVGNTVPTSCKLSCTRIVPTHLFLVSAGLQGNGRQQRWQSKLRRAGKPAGKEDEESNKAHACRLNHINPFVCSVTSGVGDSSVVEPAPRDTRVLRSSNPTESSCWALMPQVCSNLPGNREQPGIAYRSLTPHMAAWHCIWQPCPKLRYFLVHKH